jgi:hypothetical protein
MSVTQVLMWLPYVFEIPRLPAPHTNPIDIYAPSYCTQARVHVALVDL